MLCQQLSTIIHAQTSKSKELQLDHGLLVQENSPLATRRWSRSWMRWGSVGGPGWQAMTQQRGPYWAINSCSCATPKPYPAPTRGFWSHRTKDFSTALDSSLDSTFFTSGKRDVSSHPGRPEFKEEPKWQPEQLLFLPRCFLHLGCFSEHFVWSVESSFISICISLQLIGTACLVRLDEDLEQFFAWNFSFTS